MQKRRLTLVCEFAKEIMSEEWGGSKGGGVGVGGGWALIYSRIKK